MAASQQCTEQVVLCQSGRRFSALILFLGAICFLFLLLFLKRPDALLAAQFFAEDGRIFFHDQLLFGGREAFFMPYAGYLLFVPRSVAMLASLFPIETAPTVYNAAALLIAACSCAIFCLPAFRWIIASDVLRFGVCCVIAAALDSSEMSGTITQIQWYLQLAGILLVLCSGRKDFPHKAWVEILLADLPARDLSERTADDSAGSGGTMDDSAGAGDGENSGVGPFGRCGGPVVHICKRRNGSRPERPVQLPRGNSFHGGLSGVSSRIEFADREDPAAVLYARGAFVPSLLIGIAVLLWLTWLWRKADRQTRWNILGCLYFAIASAALAVGARNLPRSSDAITFGGERYFYLASCSLVLLIGITFDKFAWNPWAKGAAFAAIFSAGLWGNFKVPPYADFHWDVYCGRIAQWEDEVRSGGVVHPISVPLNPVVPLGRWTLVLEGNVLGNGGFEEANPDPMGRPGKYRHGGEARLS